jgi:type II secretory pathway predicted ATPase ExeA
VYNQFFGLNTAPFRITPDTRRFFGGGHRAAILEALHYAVASGEGIVKVTGEVGTGKTMLCRMLQESLPDTVQIAYLANPNLSESEVITAILQELGLKTDANNSSLQQHQILQQFLLDQHRTGKRVVIIIEEAQCMNSNTLEALRLLSNLETRQDKLLQLVLFGQPELNELLAQNQMRQLRDRITHSLELAPLNTDDVTDYVRFRLHSAGYRGSELFTQKTYRLLARASNGLIRRIHILADKALMAAYSSHSKQVTTHHMQAAIADSEFSSHSWIDDTWLGLGLAATLATVSLLALQFFFTDNPPSSLAEPTSDSVAKIISREELESLLQIQPAAGAPLVSTRLTASKDWLNNRMDKLTIQILLTDNDDVQTLERLFEKSELAPFLDQIYLQETTISGHRRWNVFYGNFNDRHSAQQMIEKLPGLFKTHKPYLRTTQSLRTAS